MASRSSFLLDLDFPAIVFKICYRNGVGQVHAHIVVCGAHSYSLFTFWTMNLFLNPLVDKQ